jgi:putative DNA-invertase from lambdoid prophage Rac
MRVAVYVRVSTKEQDYEMQVSSCKRYCTEHHYDIVEVFSDKKTGRIDDRPAFNRLKKEALYHRFEKVVCWKMDRLSRGTIAEVNRILETFKGYGVEVESVTEPFLNTNNPSWDLILSVMAWCANQESKRIGERVKAGIQNWKDTTGKRWHGKEWDIDRAMELRNQGIGWRSIEAEMRRMGYDVTYAGIRKELLKRGFEKGVNLPIKKPIEGTNGKSA